MALLYAFTHGSPAIDDGVIRSSYFSDYAEPLLRQVKETPTAEWDAAELEVIGLICNTLLRSQISHFQSTSYNTTVQWLSPSAEQGAAHDTIHAIAPFSIHYYAAIRPEVVETADILNLLKAQVSIVSSAPKLDQSHGVLLRHITLLINKFANPKAMQAVLSEAGLDVEVLLSSESPSPQQISLSFAVVKALLIQGKTSALTSTYLQLLLRLLPNTSAPSARLFATLLAPDDILSKVNHCAISGLYKQKAFAQLVAPIVEATRSASTAGTGTPATKQNYLLALSGILSHLPYSILEPALPSLVAPLLQTLDLRDTPVKASSLAIFESLLMHSPSLVAEHAASLITRLLNCTAAPESKTKADVKGNSADVRARALQCLALVPKQLKREAVVPFRRQIVKKLSAVLDDGKRRVRSEAVKCRTAWLGLEEAEEEDE
jgi:DNA repair/transcription protein MET18/MMS19